MFVRHDLQILTNNAIISGIIMLDMPASEWEALLSSVAHLRKILPEAVLVGDTAAALYASHRISLDHDHTLGDLRKRFDEVLAQLESVSGWKTARVRRPVLILGSLDGIETGIRQLIREEPLETEEVEVNGEKLLLPTKAEMLRIKAVLILKRNATRDYLDFVALSDLIGDGETLKALERFDALYPQPNGASPYQQLQIQLAQPQPYDLDDTNLHEYKCLKKPYQDWTVVKARCAHLANLFLTAK